MSNVSSNQLDAEQPKSSLQDDQGDHEVQYISNNLLQLWDYFISSGWKAIFKMSLYILKANEEKLLQLGFEDILNQISEQPKLILSGDCQQIDKMEEELFAGRDGHRGPSYQQPADQLAVDEDGNQIAASPTKASDMPPLPDDSNDPNHIITLYMRFKRGLDQDEEGNFLHIDYLMEKFKREFDHQLRLSEVRKERGFDD